MLISPATLFLFPSLFLSSRVCRTCQIFSFVQAISSNFHTVERNAKLYLVSDIRTHAFKVTRLSIIYILSSLLIFIAVTHVFDTYFNRVTVSVTLFKRSYYTFLYILCKKKNIFFLYICLYINKAQKNKMLKTYRYFYEKLHWSLLLLPKFRNIYISSNWVSYFLHFLTKHSQT